MIMMMYVMMVMNIEHASVPANEMPEIKTGP
jgi:hypothetical protein